MKERRLSRELTVSSAAQAAVFADPWRRRLLLSLIDREESAAELARGLEADLGRVHYHLRALKGLGLVREARLKKRAGRPIRLYTAAAPAFFVPVGLSAGSERRTLHRELLTALEAADAKSSRSGAVFDAVGGKPRMRRLQQEGGEALDLWKTLRVNPANKRALFAELRAILEKYAERDEPRSPPLLVHIAAALRR
jgi:DNA-binding transcriptional ArsR family regulator